MQGAAPHQTYDEHMAASVRRRSSRKQRPAGQHHHSLSKYNRAREKTRNVLLIWAGLIAAAAFASFLQYPFGVDGEAAIGGGGYEHVETAFRWYVVCNSAAFFLSSTAILLELISAMHGDILRKVFDVLLKKIFNLDPIELDPDHEATPRQQKAQAGVVSPAAPKPGHFFKRFHTQARGTVEGSLDRQKTKSMGEVVAMASLKWHRAVLRQIEADNVQADEEKMKNAIRHAKRGLMYLVGLGSFVSLAGLALAAAFVAAAYISFGRKGSKFQTEWTVIFVLGGGFISFFTLVWFALVLIYFFAPKKYLAPKRQDSMQGESGAEQGSAEAGDLESGKDSGSPSESGEAREIKAHRP